MKLYSFAMAPNPRKVLVYLREKGLDVPIVPVDIMKGANRTPEFLAKNPLGGLPVLELDDGTCLTESLAIIEYIEELYPNPPLIGTSPLERARVRELERISEMGVLSGVAVVFQNTSPLFAGRLKQSPEAADTGRARMANALKVLDERIGLRPFVAGERPTIADCTLNASLAFGEFAGAPLEADKYPNVARWWEAFRQRPSCQG